MPAGGNAIVAGDVNITKLDIISTSGVMWDLRPQLATLVIFEDVFSPFMTAKLVIKDAVDFANIFPLIGEEMLIMEYNTPGYEGLSMTWAVYKYDSRARVKEREANYTLYLISLEATTDLNKKISKTFQGKVSDIVTEVLQTDPQGLQTGRKIDIEETKNTTKYTSNFWSPIYNLNYLTANAINIKGSPTYLFYENKDGYHFRSIQSLYDPPEPFKKFMWGNYSDKVKPTGGSDHDIEKDYTFILDYKTPETFDYMERLRQGFYGSRMIMYDITIKKYHRTDFTRTRIEPLLNKADLWRSPIYAEQAVQLVEPRYLNNMPGYGDVTNTNTLQQRINQLQQADAFKVEITVHGRSDYKIGQLIELNIPKNAELTKDENAEDFKDFQYSGLYLLVAISHQITRQEHKTIMELAKDSFLQKLYDNAGKF